MMNFIFSKKIEVIKNLLKSKIDNIVNETTNIVNLSSNNLDENTNVEQIDYIKVVKDNKLINLDVNLFKEIIGLKKIEDVFSFGDLKRFDLILDKLKINNVIYKDNKVYIVIYNGDNNKNLLNRIRYNYDDKGKLIKLEYFYNSKNSSDKKAEKKFIYDEDGKLKSVTYTEF